MNYPKRHLVTSALPYANGPLHIGHLSGAYLSADIYVRFLRMMGKDVVFVCGSDENGAAITMRAMKEGVSPQEIIDKYHQLFEKTFRQMGISFDIYHRTSSALHHETSQDFFRTLFKKGEFIEKTTHQYFDEQASQFLADRYIKGKCPKCGYEEAYGDQCENCGSSLSPKELIEPVSTLSGEKPVLKETTHWYLPLHQYEDWLREWIETGKLDGDVQHDPDAWKNHVVGQCKSWLDAGLKPRAMTRDLDWGVDVPPEIPGSKGKKLYVWMDAPIGYISATRQWAKDNAKDWKTFWQDGETALVHFIGKDNIVFHCLIFPAILKAHGAFVLPVNVPANQFMNLEGKKISTSKNWAVWVHEYTRDFEGQEDVLRYHLIKNMPELRDSEFTWKAFQDSNNNDLVNNFANFVHRVVVLTHKYYKGKVPDFDPDLAINSATEADSTSFHDAEILHLFDKLDQLCAYIRLFDFRSALKTLMEISDAGNQLLQFNEPWKIQKSDPDTVCVVMHLAMQYVAALSLACRPFMPFTSDRICDILRIPKWTGQGELLDTLNAFAEGLDIVPAGSGIAEPRHLFQRMDDAIIAKQIARLHRNEVESDVDPAKAAGIKSEINYDDFAKLDLRTATILSAQKVPKTDKLLELQLDLGFETRTVVSGIAKSYDPEDVIGKRVVLLANLSPRKIRGIQSQGMILMAEGSDEKLAFISPETDWENGSTIS